MSSSCHVTQSIVGRYMYSVVSVLCVATVDVRA